MHQDVKKFTSSCWACASATPTTSTPPMAMRSTPERVWSEVQADFKGPVGGRYYFHVVIDQLSRWPEVEISTRFYKLYLYFAGFDFPYSHYRLCYMEDDLGQGWKSVA